MKILLIDNDIETTQLLSCRLRQDGYVVEVVADSEYAVDFLQADSYDLVLLDLISPELSGIEVCRRLRCQYDQTPVLIMAERNEISDKVASFDAGADDYLVKPFELDELAARVRALIRRNSEVLSAVSSYGPLEFDSSTRTLTLFEEPISLRPKELAILELMLYHPSHVFDSNSILNKLWRLSECPGTATVKSHIRSLRKQFEAAGATNIIETVRGTGYRLNSSLLDAVNQADGRTNQSLKTQNSLSLPSRQTAVVKQPLVLVVSHDSHWSQALQNCEQNSPFHLEICSPQTIDKIIDQCVDECLLAQSPSVVVIELSNAERVADLRLLNALASHYDSQAAILAVIGSRDPAEQLVAIQHGAGAIALKNWSPRTLLALIAEHI